MSKEQKSSFRKKEFEKRNVGCLPAQCLWHNNRWFISEFCSSVTQQSELWTSELRLTAGNSIKCFSLAAVSGISENVKIKTNMWGRGKGSQGCRITSTVSPLLPHTVKSEIRKSAPASPRASSSNPVSASLMWYWDISESRRRRIGDSALTAQLETSRQRTRKHRRVRKHPISSDLRPTSSFGTFLFYVRMSNCLCSF